MDSLVKSSKHLRSNNVNLIQILLENKRNNVQLVLRPVLLLLQPENDITSKL